MRKTVVVPVVVLLVFCAAVASAQRQKLEPSRIASVKANVPAYVNEVVRIDGYVTQLVDSGSRSTSFFVIKDDWGAVIRVRTSKQPPSVGKKYQIEGPVSIDPKSKDLYLSEEFRQEIFIETEAAIKMQESAEVSPPWRAQTQTQTQSTSAGTATAASGVTSDEPTTATSTGTSTATGMETAKSNKTLMYLLIGGAALAILGIVLFLVLRSRSDEGQTMDFSVATATGAPVDAPPPPEQVIEGRTIKMHAPPPNTVKLLPGWFEVVSGDDVVKQIRFYKLGGEHGAETTFGRASGRPYAHIQLKVPTVSSRQAKVTFDNGAVRLTNFASSESNPTRLNGRDLDVNESVPLKDSDRVEMGEVSLLFHEAQSSGNVVPA